MRTSSGDVISLDFANEQTLSMKQTKSSKESSSSFSFTSMQSFQFEVQSNGIDAQDKKEIKAFMKIAQPFIDNFMEELSSNKQTTPLNQVTKALDEIFSPLKEKDQNTRHHAKNEIVKTFDKSASQIDQFENILKESQQLLENVLNAFNKTTQELYV
jgi:pyrroloquinoline quinone (PQQ) biosynthesis protein C